jgi:hypothetical protein
VIFHQRPARATSVKEVKGGSSKISDRTALQERQTAQGVDRPLAGGRTAADGTVGRVRRGILLRSVADLPTRRDAQLKLDERLRPVNQGVSRPESTIGFGAFVKQHWTVLVLPTFKRTTQHGYRAVLRVHVLPTWQDIPLREIDRLAIQQWVADRLRRGIGWQSVRNAWVLLSSILETAVEYGYLQSNPAPGVKFPQKALRRKPAMIAGDDFAKLLRELSETHRTMVSLIAATGLRIGELLALRWSSLDLEAGRWRPGHRCSKAHSRHRRPSGHCGRSRSARTP